VPRTQRISAFKSVFDALWRSLLAAWGRCRAGASYLAKGGGCSRDLRAHEEMPTRPGHEFIQTRYPAATSRRPRLMAP